MGRFSFATRVLLAALISPLLLLAQGGVAGSGGVTAGTAVQEVNPQATPDKKQNQDSTSEDDDSFKFKVTVNGRAGLSTSRPDAGTTRFDADLLRGLPMPAEDVLSLITPFVSPAAQGSEGISMVVDGFEAGELEVPSSAIRRIRIDQDPYSAQFQYPGDTRVEIYTKRGHKSFYDGSFLMSARNSFFDARNAFASSIPDLDRRLLQANFGGPLPGKRASFYLAGEHIKDNESAVVNAVTPEGPFITNVPTSQRRERIFTRLQWWPSDLHTIYLTYTFRERSLRNDQVGGFNLPEQGVSTKRHGHQIVLSDSVALGGQSHNDLLLSFKQQDEHAGNPATGAAIVVDEAFTGGPSQSFIGEKKRTFNLQDTVTYVRGMHAVLFGARTRADVIDAFDASNFGGTFEFSSLAQFTSLAPFVFRVNQGNPNIGFTAYMASGFVQDEIRVRTDLTLTFGLRYDWQSTRADKNNLAPRFAFAFSPGKNYKTIVRGGAGIFYDNLPLGATEQSLLLDGVRLREVVISAPAFPDPFSGGQVTSPLPSVTRVAPRIESPTLLQASIAIDRELWHENWVSVQYAYLRGIHLFRSRDINAPLPTNGLRPDPNFLNIDEVESTAFQRSHAMTLTFRGRIGKVFKPYAQYVFSKSMNDTSGIFTLPANNYDLRPEIGPADFDSRHRLNLMSVLELPWGFRLGSVLSVATGIPFNITTGFDNNGDTVANDRPPGVTRNTGRGPGTMELDVRFTKAFKISHLWNGDQQTDRGHTAEFSVDAFNVTNHTNVTTVVGALSSPFFGRANEAAPARTLQFSVRYFFRK